MASICANPSQSVLSPIRFNLIASSKHQGRLMESFAAVQTVIHPSSQLSDTGSCSYRASLNSQLEITALLDDIVSGLEKSNQVICSTSRIRGSMSFNINQSASNPKSIACDPNNPYVYSALLAPLISKSSLDIDMLQKLILEQSEMKRKIDQFMSNIAQLHRLMCFEEGQQGQDQLLREKHDQDIFAEPNRNDIFPQSNRNLIKTLQQSQTGFHCQNTLESDDWLNYQPMSNIVSNDRYDLTQSMLTSMKMKCTQAITQSKAFYIKQHSDDRYHRSDGEDRVKMLTSMGYKQCISEQDRSVRSEAERKDSHQEDQEKKSSEESMKDEEADLVRKNVKSAFRMKRTSSFNEVKYDRLNKENKKNSNQNRFTIIQSKQEGPNQLPHNSQASHQLTPNSNQINLTHFQNSVSNKIKQYLNSVLLAMSHKVISDQGWLKRTTLRINHGEGCQQTHNSNESGQQCHMNSNTTPSNEQDSSTPVQFYRTIHSPSQSCQSSSTNNVTISQCLKANRINPSKNPNISDQQFITMTEQQFMTFMKKCSLKDNTTLFK